MRFVILIFGISFLSIGSLFGDIANNMKLSFVDSRFGKMELELEKNLFRKGSFLIGLNEKILKFDKTKGFDFGFRYFYRPTRVGWFNGLGVNTSELEDAERVYLELGVRYPFPKLFFLQLNYRIQIVNSGRTTQFDPQYKFYLGYYFREGRS